MGERHGRCGDGKSQLLNEEDEKVPKSSLNCWFMFEIEEVFVVLVRVLFQFHLYWAYFHGLFSSSIMTCHVCSVSTSLVYEKRQSSFFFLLFVLFPVSFSNIDGNINCRT